MQPDILRTGLDGVEQQWLVAYSILIAFWMVVGVVALLVWLP